MPTLIVKNEEPESVLCPDCGYVALNGECLNCKEWDKPKRKRIPAKIYATDRYKKRNNDITPNTHS